MKQELEYINKYSLTYGKIMKISYALVMFLEY